MGPTGRRLARLTLDTLADLPDEVRSCVFWELDPVRRARPVESGEATGEEPLKHVNIPGLLAWANKAKFAVNPPSGKFETVEDLEGQLVAGNPDEAVAECKKFEAIGVEHLVFDFRFKFDKWYDQIELLGSEVLPRLRG